MTQSQQIAKHFRDIHFGGNWTCSNLRDNLADVTWEPVITQIYTQNTIATLDEKYGTYYRNLHGIIEHSHYHLGQIAIIKKIILLQENDKKANSK